MNHITTAAKWISNLGLLYSKAYLDPFMCFVRSAFELSKQIRSF